MTCTELTTASWQHLAADQLGPLPTGDYVSVVVHYYSRFFEMEFTKSTISEKIVLTMVRSLPVNILRSTWRKTELHIDEPHPYGHKPMVK